MLLLCPCTGVTFSGGAFRHPGSGSVTRFNVPLGRGRFRDLDGPGSGMNVR